MLFHFRVRASIGFNHYSPGLGLIHCLSRGPYPDFINRFRDGVQIQILSILRPGRSVDFTRGLGLRQNVTDIRTVDPDPLQLLFMLAMFLYEEQKHISDRQKRVKTIIVIVRRQSWQKNI